ncbi:MAG: hypothetical protein ACPHDT_15170 [Acidimicrobiales bacterium]
MSDRPDLVALAAPFKDHQIQTKPGGFGARYVSHSEVQQRLLFHLGPTPQRVVELIRNADGQVHGVILEMTFTIDGEQVTIQEAGDCERPGGNDALNTQMAISSGIARCCMRVGLGLHLWAGDHYVLDRALTPKGE